VEVYHNLYTSKVKAEAMRRGYGNLNEEAVEAERQVAVVVDDGAAVMLSEEETKAKAVEEEEKACRRIQEYRRLRMAIMRTAAATMLQSESAEVKAQIVAETMQRNSDRESDDPEDGARSPEQFQKYVFV
jgi:hypothetical protein